LRVLLLLLNKHADPAPPPLSRSKSKKNQPLGKWPLVTRRDQALPVVKAADKALRGAAAVSLYSWKYDACGAASPTLFQSTMSRRSFLRRAACLAVLAGFSWAAQAADLTVSGAVSLTNAFRELGPLFEAQNPGTKLLFNFAASDALLAQIANGAPVDVFASADQQTMDKADAQKLLAPFTRRDFVTNTLVLVVPVDSPLGLKDLADLPRPEVKHVAIGNPASVPAGRYAQGALEAAKLWQVVNPKAVFAQNVRQALDYVARGEAEAGFVYSTDAALMKDKVKAVATVATGKPIAYPAARTANSPNKDGAARFLDFLASPVAQGVLARHGFAKP
jgi:molybdate transport system substrate-binding protein